MMVATSFERAEVIRLPGFWDAVAASERSLLALDYDGTLAPFHVDRMKAHPLPGIKRLIRKLAGLDRTEVAIISGRPLAELSDLVGLTGVTLVGSHGFETRAVTGESVVRSPSPIQLQGLEIAEKAVVGSGYAGRVEKKVASLALHTRGIGAARAVAITREVEQLWSQTAEKYDLECRVFKGGIELRSAGWHKGDVLLLLVRDLQPGLTVYIGDDETDEDAFRVLDRGGIGIKVGAPGGETAARGFLPNCEAVRSFLHTWLSTQTGKD